MSLRALVLGAALAVSPLQAFAEFAADALWRGFEAGLNPATCPSFGDATLSPVDLIEAHAMALLAGGPVDATALGGDCSGYVAAAPDYRIELSGELPALLISFEADDPDEPVSLIVNAPDGRWRCSSEASPHSLLTLTPGAVGQYDFWIGSTRRDTFVPGRLRVAAGSIDPAAQAR